MNRARRDLVRSLGGAAVALPFLRTLPARAAGEPGPKRLVVVQTANGTIRNEYLPEGGEKDFKFRRILAPLEPHRSKLLVLDGIDMKSFYAGPRASHGGLLHQLVGRSAIDNKGQGKRTDYTAGGASLDQVVAEKIQGEAPVRSLELGVRCRGAGNYQTCSYKGPNAPNPVVDNPYEVYDRLFRNVQAPDREQKERIRGGVADFVVREFGGLRSRLGAAERRQLDADLSSLRQVEKSFRTLRSPSGSCQPPQPGARVDHGAVANVPAILQLQTDLLVAALQCDVTRVATVMWYDTDGGDEALSFLGINRTHHDLAHTSDTPGNPVGESLVTINRWYAEQFKLLLDRMAAIPDGDGTLLDSSVVLYANSLGNGRAHRVENVPYIIAGSGGGYFRTGRYLRYKARPHNDLLTSLAQAFGLPMATFGDSRFNTGPLSELR